MIDLAPPAHNAFSPFANMRGHHVAVRTPEYESVKRWYVDTLDFRVVAEWEFADQRLGLLAPPADDHFCIEFLGGASDVHNSTYTDDRQPAVCRARNVIDDFRRAPPQRLA